MFVQVTAKNVGGVFETQCRNYCDVEKTTTVWTYAK